MAHAGRAHLDQHLAGARANHLHVVTDVELGVTNRVEYRSAHGAPPISGEFCCDPLKSRTGCSQSAQAWRAASAAIRDGETSKGHGRLSGQSLGFGRHEVLETAIYVLRIKWQIERMGPMPAMRRASWGLVGIGVALAAAIPATAALAAKPQVTQGWRIVYRHVTPASFSFYNAIAASDSAHAWAVGGTGVAGIGSPI